jgi:hypothetical protein
MKKFWSMRRFELQIYLREFFGPRPKVCALVAAPVAIIVALAFVLEMPSWGISHSAVNLPSKKIEVKVEEIYWTRPAPRGGFGVGQSAVFTIEDHKIQRVVPFPAKQGDTLVVDYAKDSDGRILIKSIASPPSS